MKFFVVFILCLASVKAFSEQLSNYDDLYGSVNGVDDESTDRRPDATYVRGEGRGRSVSRKLNLTTRLGIAAGITTMSQASATNSNLKVTRTFYAGGNFDMAFHFFGIEAEGYWGTGGADIGNNNEGESSRILQAKSASLSQYGILANANLQLPFDIGRNFRVKPRAGLGYGLMSLNLSTDLSIANSSALVDGGRTQKVSGLYALGGLTVEPTTWLEIYGDFAKSVTASADVTGSVSAVSATLPANSPSFNRLRLGVLFRLNDMFLLGAQFIQRSIDASATGIALGQFEGKQRHFLGNFMIEF